MIRLLLISSYDPHASSPHQHSLEAFAARCTTDDIEVAYCSVRELVFVVTKGQAAVLKDGVDIANTFSAVYLRNMNFYPDYARALQIYGAIHGMTVLNEQDLTYPAYGKTSQGFLFAQHHIPTPDLIAASHNATLRAYLAHQSPAFPYIVKHNDGIKGAHNYLVHDAAQLASVLESDKHGYVAQPYITNSGELRILTFGDDIEPLIFKKSAAQGTHLNNTAQGGSVTPLALADVDPAIIDSAQRAARVTNRQIGGVDVLLADDGSWYVLEVNHTPALASGALLEEKAAYFKKYLRNLGADR
ncbi:MAG TPA: ATP-grasp domain-containing protein [Candidatus Saccharimonadales bacterium]|nr:ATP-grasp domain-containing protein [Candidatus Saccharimonadales bacterium]